MPSKHHSGEGTTAGATLDSQHPNAASVRQQLDRLLASPQLRNSKRCQALLKHVVEAYLDGSLERVKERCIGFEVFQRGADYDTSHDSIVRTTAAEVRKRLAQYYLEPEHEHEIRVALPHGTYSPEFRLPPAIPPLTVQMEPVAPFHTAPRRPWWILASVGVLVLMVLTIVFVKTRPNEFDRFWMPLLDDKSETVICIEQPLRIFRFTGPRVAELNQKMVGAGATPAAPADQLGDTSLHLSDLELAGRQYFTYGDLMAASRLSELLGRKGKAFQILGDRNTAYRDLRGRPAILLGQFNNQWTLGLTSGLRYYLDKNEAERRYEIHDRQAPGKVIASIPMGNRPEEYSIVSRIFDASTEKTVIAVIGTTFMGTLAGSDFLTHAPYMQEAFRSAPANWYHKNIQVVLRAAVVGGTPGPPRVIATHFW
ncbi:MAG: hypothetical protein JWP63_3893 [Candidatus Solibacter sp.]|nr:hypothetical protein [Candidatus Solibacter sp.]